MITSTDDILQTRTNIDAIDDQILALAELRLHLATNLRALKTTESPPWDPVREHAVLQRLMAQRNEILAPEVLLSMWNALITASLMRQGPLVLLTQSSEMNALGLAAFPNAATENLAFHNWRQQIADTKGSIAILPYPSDQQTWWCTLAKPDAPVQVKACLPKWPPDRRTACCLSVGGPPYQSGQTCWSVIEETSEYAAQGNEIARAKGLVLLESDRPLDAQASTISIGNFF
ncbi:MAG: chorismate mutase [Robiginitomaculum sp.]|nr:chorismate mutase [Robiginitomaculum sp.]